MEERTQIFKSFEGKKVVIKTNSDFVYHTDNLLVYENSVFFIDNRGQETLLSFSEIKFIQEEK